jgi:acetoin utilization protein AcuC
MQSAGLSRIAYIDIDAHHCDGVAHGFAKDPSVLMMSVHEEARWPFTGSMEDRGAGNMVNLPVPRGFNDTEMAVVRDHLIVPCVTAHRPDAIVLQCGADALIEDPLSRLALSNNAHRAVLAALRPLAPRLLVLGGGGYNPWSVGRLWSLIWADMAGHSVPDRLPPQAEAVLRGLSWGGGGRPAPEPSMLTTLADPSREGSLRAEVLARIQHLQRAISPEHRLS